MQRFHALAGPAGATRRALRRRQQRWPH